MTTGVTGQGKLPPAPEGAGGTEELGEGRGAAAAPAAVLSGPGLTVSTDPALTALAVETAKLEAMVKAMTVTPEERQKALEKKERLEEERELDRELDERLAEERQEKV